MSKVKIKGNASGTGVLTIEAPNTNTDRTITLPDSTGNILMSDGDGSNLTGLSSSALSRDFTVATGKSVANGEIVNLGAGTIGNHPVPPTLGTTLTEGSNTFYALNETGTVGVRAYTDGSGNAQIESYLISDSAITSQGATQAYAKPSNTTIEASIISASGNKFIVYGRGYSYPNGNTRMVIIEVNPSTGAVTVGNVWTQSYSSNNPNYSSSSLILYNLDCAESGRMGVYHYYYDGSTPHSYNYYTFSTSGTNNISTQTTDSSVRSYADSLEAGSYLITPTSGATWNRCNWDGVDVSSHTTISTGYTTGAETPAVFRPISGTDTYLFAFKNTSGQLVTETYSFSGGNLNKVSGSTYIIQESVASDYELGNLIGTTTGVLLSYMENSKSYIIPLVLDANYIATAQGIKTQLSATAEPATMHYSGASDIYRMFFNGNTAIVRKVTVSAYVSDSLNIIGVAQEAGSAGASVSVATDGVASGFTGLTAGADYYYDTTVYDGTVTTTITGVLIGKAVSTTEILL